MFEEVLGKTVIMFKLVEGVEKVKQTSGRDRIPKFMGAVKSKTRPMNPTDSSACPVLSLPLRIESGDARIGLPYNPKTHFIRALSKIEKPCRTTADSEEYRATQPYGRWKNHSHYLFTSSTQSIDRQTYSII
jgi:hypothetical protein